MIPLNIVLEGDGCWPDLREKGFTNGKLVSIARLPRGTTLGNSSVAVRIELPDGKIVLAETTMALFLAAASAFKAREEMKDESRRQ